ncbi:hypothetical protein M434DRAFT_10828 [Hypoxylon sp. CO27-5]|nr:hypothetical protein M434DRAFT_10828 [Hypoxylon sp. CO27-5]
MSKDDMEASSPSLEPDHEYVLHKKSQACKWWFKKCVELSDFDDDWLEQKCAEFNWWASGLNADKSGPGSLDARLRLRLDVRDVVVGLLDSLEAALCRYHEIVTSNASLSEKDLHIVETGGQSPTSDKAGRAPSPWSDMTDGSEHGSSSDTFGDTNKDQQGHITKSSVTNSKLTENTPDRSNDQRGVGGGQNTENSASPDPDVYHEQRVYIHTNLEILIRIHTSIKHSGHKFRNLRVDDALKEADEKFQQRKAVVGEHQALTKESGKHETLRRYFTKLILRNGYTEKLMQRMSFKIDERCENLMQSVKGGTDKSAEDLMEKWDRKIDKLSEIVRPANKDYSEILLENKLLIVLRAYFNDPARLTTATDIFINANVVRQNALLHVGSLCKTPSRTLEKHIQPLLVGSPM